MSICFPLCPRIRTLLDGSWHFAFVPEADIATALSERLVEYVWYRADTRMAFSVLDLGGHGHEILVKHCRALSYRHLVNCIAVRPERYGSVANRNRLRHPTSQHHDRRAEAGGKATEAAADGKATTEADADGKHSCISPDIANHSNAIGTANRSKAGACERFSNGEACRA
jgi:hypothetical protein